MENLDIRILIAESNIKHKDVAKQIDYYGFKQDDLDATLKKLKGGS